MKTQSSYALQRTVRTAMRFSGVCLHTGRQAGVVVGPAPANSGILFQFGNSMFRADNKFSCTGFRTTSLRWKLGYTARTVEHLLAALSAYRADNVIISFPNSSRDQSVPILDGSSQPFADKLEGNVSNALIDNGDTAKRRCLVVLRTVHVEEDNGKGFACLHPTTEKEGLHLSAAIDFGPLIQSGAGGTQEAQFFLPMDGLEGGASFRKTIAPSRTFCFESHLPELRRRGLIRGGSLDNALVFSAGDGRCLTPGGLRFDNEPARHKLLDCIGDLALCQSGNLIARYEAFRPGHGLTQKLLGKLLADPRNFAVVTDP